MLKAGAFLMLCALTMCATASEIDKVRVLVTRNEKLLEDRRSMSRRMNDIMQEYSKMSCALADKVENAKGEYVPEEYVGRKFSKTGAWCYNESKFETGLHLTDQGLVGALTKLFAGKRVGSFGDGPGHYKRDLLAIGDVKQYDAYDGAPFCEETSEGRVKYLDLTIPQYGLPLYDWTMSLEVAEHIPPKYEGIYIDNLLRHARVGAIISWGVPGQLGLGHVNSRSKQYVIDLLAGHGFKHDPDGSAKLQDAAQMWHFHGKQQGHEEGNVQMFRRRDDHPAHPDDA